MTYFITETAGKDILGIHNFNSQESARDIFNAIIEEMGGNPEEYSNSDTFEIDDYKLQIVESPIGKN